MSTTSFDATAQSSRERRLPLTVSMRAPSRHRLRRASILSILLEGRAKQRRLRKPRSSRASTSLDPMKPAAPVIRIRSSRPTMEESPFDGFIFSLFADIGPANRIEAHGRKYSSGVIREFEDVIHELGLP